MSTYEAKSNIQDCSNFSNVSYHTLILSFPTLLMLCKLQCQILLCAVCHYQLQQQHNTKSHNHRRTRWRKMTILKVCSSHV